METQRKPGIWTEHADPATGRPYYFNMVENRSYWTLPEELLAQVKRPLAEALRGWNSQEEPTMRGDDDTRERQRQKRELVLAAARVEQEQQQSQNSHAAGAGGHHGMTALQDRMALAAQRKAEQRQRMAQRNARAQGVEGDGSANGQQDATSDTSEYLQLVQKLQATDRNTEGSGSKWLVR